MFLSVRKIPDLKSKDLSQKLGVKVFPGIVSDYYNRIAVYRQETRENSPVNASGSRSMTRLWTAGQSKPQVFHGKQSERIGLVLKDGEQFVRIASGCNPAGDDPLYAMNAGDNSNRSSGPPNATLAVGIAKPPADWVRPGTYFTSKAFGGAARHDKEPYMNSHMAFTLTFAPRHDGMYIAADFTNMGLGLPRDKDIMDDILGIVGDTVRDIQSGKAIDFTTLRLRLINEAGLIAAGEPEQTFRQRRGGNGGNVVDATSRFQAKRPLRLDNDYFPPPVA
jgi:hypothetical protein